MWIALTLSLKFKTRKRKRSFWTLILIGTFKSWEEICFRNLIEFTLIMNRRAENLKLDFMIKSSVERTRTWSKINWSKCRDFKTSKWN